MRCISVDRYLTDELYEDDYTLDEYVSAGDVIFAVYSGNTLILSKFGCGPEEVEDGQLGFYAFLPLNLLDELSDEAENEINELQDDLWVRIWSPDDSVRIIPLSKVAVEGCGISFQIDESI